MKKVKAKRGGSIYTKSGMMLGLGETEEEIIAGDGGFARGELRHAHARPVFAADVEAFAGGGDLLRRSNLTFMAGRRAAWDLSTSPALRWCAVLTTRMNLRRRRKRTGGDGQNAETVGAQVVVFLDEIADQDRFHRQDFALAFKLGAMGKNGFRRAFGQNLVLMLRRFRR